VLAFPLGTLNPENVVVGWAAAGAVAAGSPSIGQQSVVTAIYVFAAVLGVAAPILVMLFLGDRASEVLDGWKIWLRQNHACVMSVLFVVLGVVLIGQGIAGLEVWRPVPTRAMPDRSNHPTRRRDPKRNPRSPFALSHSRH
jgi:hypothetical protein